MDIHVYRDLLIIWVLELARTGCANLHPGIESTHICIYQVTCAGHAVCYIYAVTHLNVEWLRLYVPSNSDAKHLREGVMVAAYLEPARHSQLFSHVHTCYKSSISLHECI